MAAARPTPPAPLSAPDQVENEIEQCYQLADRLSDLLLALDHHNFQLIECSPPPRDPDGEFDMHYAAHEAIYEESKRRSRALAERLEALYAKLRLGAS
jgi:hypothetical protein